MKFHSKFVAFGSKHRLSYITTLTRAPMRPMVHGENPRLDQYGNYYNGIV